MTISLTFEKIQSSTAITTLIAATDSMAPMIRTNDRIMVNESSPYKNLKIDDIIAFYASDPIENNKTIVSRISAIIEPGNNLTGNVQLCAPIAINEVIQEKTILTKGDSNECSIPGIDFPITSSNYLGQVIKISDYDIN